MLLGTLLLSVAPCDEQFAKPGPNFIRLPFAERVMAQVDTFEMFGRWHSANVNSYHRCIFQGRPTPAEGAAKGQAARTNTNGAPLPQLARPDRISVGAVRDNENWRSLPSLCRPWQFNTSCCSLTLAQRCGRLLAGAQDYDFAFRLSFKRSSAAFFADSLMCE